MKTRAKSRTLFCVTRMMLLAALTFSVLLEAQEQQEHGKKEHPGYSIVDLGTLGGNNSFPQGINDLGQVVGWAETSDTDPNSGFPVFHAFLWNKGVMHDLGTLGGLNSEAGLGGINLKGEVVGDAQTQTVDPNNAPFLESHAFLFRKGVMTDLGTLGGIYSFASAIDREHRVVGGAQTVETDPSSGQQFHPFLWQRDVMSDLGTLGGPYGYAFGINPNEDHPESQEQEVTEEDRAWNRTKGREIRVVGGASVDSTPVPPFAPGPPLHAFLWEKGVMRNLGALGGIQSVAVAINDRSQVAGEFTFLDSEGIAITHAARWEDGRAQDLGTVTGDHDSISWAINHNGHIVGASGSGFVDAFTPAHAFLWEGGALTDLNTLIPENPDLQLIAAYGINARGQIAALAFEFSTGSVRTVLLNPHDSSTSTNEDFALTVAAIAAKPALILSENVRNLLQRATPGSRMFRAWVNQK